MIQCVYKVRETKPRSRKKDLKKIKKVLDKPHKVWYNKDTKRTGTSGNRKKWVVTDTKSQEDRKEIIMTTNEMTLRKYHEAVAAIPNAPADVVAKAKAELAKMDASNAKNRGTESKTYKANIPLFAEVLALLAEKPMLTAEVAAAMNSEERPISTSKASGLLRTLEKEGKVISAKVKVKGKGEQTQYTIAPSEE
jgi:hypothetical protein